jgi:coenzyme PQQ precursor peptide PqqA
MPWSKPDFVEISLCMEVTAYVNTDEPAVHEAPPLVREETQQTSSPTPEN